VNPDLTPTLGREAVVARLQIHRANPPHTPGQSLNESRDPRAALTSSAVEQECLHVSKNGILHEHRHLLPHTTLFHTFLCLKNTPKLLPTQLTNQTIQDVRQSAHEEANPRSTSSQSARNEEARPSTSPQLSFSSQAHHYRPDDRSTQDASSQSTRSQSTHKNPSSQSTSSKSTSGVESTSQSARPRTRSSEIESSRATQSRQLDQPHSPRWRGERRELCGRVDWRGGKQREWDWSWDWK
jgi:hypothetical protein